MLRIYEVTRDKQGTPIMRHLADVATWRESHRYRRLQKYQRTLPDKTPITTMVYDETGKFLWTP